MVLPGGNGPLSVKPRCPPLGDLIVVFLIIQTVIFVADPRRR